jgi:alpha-galactosidase
MKSKILLLDLFMLLGLLLFSSCSRNESNIQFFHEDGIYSLENNNIKFKFDNKMRCNVYRKYGDQLLSIINKSDVPHYIIVNGIPIRNFTIDEKRVKFINIKNKFGRGKRLKLSGTASGPSESLIEMILYTDIYDKFPEAILQSIEYKNVNATPGLFIEKEINNEFKLNASLVNPDDNKYDFWICQGGSYKSRPDWIVPVTKDFSCENYQGQRIEIGEKGGGLPVLDVWNKETGFFIGSTRKKPALISLPAFVDNEECLNISIQYDRNNMKFERNVYKSIPTVIGVHKDDFYNGLRMYSKIMECKGLKMLTPTDPSYESIWCGWGFGPNFTTKQMIDMIPILKELNFKVVTVDMGWFYCNGDFIPRDDTFPNLDEDMKKFVKVFHDNGFKIKLWTTWSIAGTELMKEHPEWLVRDKEGNPIMLKIGASDKKAAYICPALKSVQEYHREITRKFIKDWDYDGFKVDQSIINSISECYAEGHNHEYPARSVEELPEIYKIIYEETIKLKPDAILEVCPCGQFPSFYKMPYYNQPVSSDFKYQWQIRNRGKVIKALMGPNAAYYGDHVERHYKNSNFASMVGVGGIPGTMAVSKPEDNWEVIRAKYPCYLSPEKKVHFKKWLDIYRKNPLSKGEYLNLYDIAYDKPETHAIKKDNNMYYAFYASEWDGEVELRGLDDKSYIIHDYVNDKEVGRIKGGEKLKIQFEEYLLVKAVPAN